MSATPGTLFPWRDDALLPGESLYALWNKFAWFAATGPADLLRQCRAKDGKQFVTPTQLAYAPPANWTRYLRQVTVASSIHGLTLFKALSIRVLWEEAEVPTRWRSRYLRVCDSCIALGVHLRFHQHLAVTRCPIHKRLLRSVCPACGHELDYISANRQRAFTCTHCGCDLLHADGIRFGFEDSFSERYAHATSECRKWLRRLHAMPGGSGAIVNQMRDPDAAATDSGPRFLALAAFTSSVADVPFWFRKCKTKGFVTRLASMDPEEVVISRSIHSVTGLDELGIKRTVVEKLGWDPWKEGAHAEERAASRLYHRTIMRVASCFLRQVGAKHHVCLDVPPRITGKSLENDLLGWQWHILDCCPIAVGFWLWRLQSASRFTNCVYNPKVCAKALGHMAIGPSSSLLYYVAERSRLHACMIVAHRCRRLWLKTGCAFPALSILHNWESRSDIFMMPPKFGLRFRGGRNDVAVLRLDASALIADVTCLGDAALHDWIADKTSAMRSLREEERSEPR